MDVPPTWWCQNLTFCKLVIDGYANRLGDKFQFDEFMKGEIKLNNIEFQLSTGGYHGEEYGILKLNDYDYIGKTSRSGNKIVKYLPDNDLHLSHLSFPEMETYYIYSIARLHDKCIVNLNKWLIYNDYETWTRWRLYFEVIVQNSSEQDGDYYRHFWFSVLNEVDNWDIFDDVQQYKQFIRIKEKFEKESDHIERKIIELNQAKQ